MDDDLEEQIRAAYEYEEFIEKDDDSGGSDGQTGCCVWLVACVGGASPLFWA